MRRSLLVPILLSAAAVTATVAAGCAVKEDPNASPSPSVSSSAPASSAPASSASTPASPTPTKDIGLATGNFDKLGVQLTGGGFGKKPVIQHRKGSPGTTTGIAVVSEGKGAVVKKNDLLLADYEGAVWSTGKVFDNSYDRGAPAPFQIGAGAVIPGWDKTLVGQHVGSRVVLSIPSADGYGKSGNAQAGIGGTDTLIFVVDIQGTYNGTTKLDASAPKTLPKSDPQITGALDAAPTVKVPSGVKAPAKAGTPVTLAAGNGAAVTKGQTIIARYAVYDYAGKSQFSTWTQGQQTQSGTTLPPAPQPIPLNQAGQATPLDNLVGQKVGSRVFLQLPASKDSAGKTLQAFAVVDILTAIKTPAAATGSGG